jgi:superfamily II DNA or RNA helicase
MKDCPTLPFIGLSATPWSRGLGKFYDELIVASTTADLIRSGYLSDFTAFAPSEPDLAGVRTVAGDFHEGELAEAMDRPKITGDIVSTWFERAEGLPTFVFCVNRRHAQHVAERFAEAGVAVEYMDGNTPREEREATFARFRSGETTIICNVGVLTTGVDLDVRCIVDTKPTKSRILFVQTIGRGLRTAEGKDKLLILDHAGNHLRLGMVTDIGEDRLDDGKERPGAQPKDREKRAPLPKLCDDCKAVIPAGAKSCLSCGAQIHAKTDIDAVEGELVEFGVQRSGKREIAAWEKARFYAELLGYAERKGFKSGWAFHKFIERFKHQPAGYPHVAMEPSVATLNWIKSRQIAWAKAKAGMAA